MGAVKTGGDATMRKKTGGDAAMRKRILFGALALLMTSVLGAQVEHPPGSLQADLGTCDASREGFLRKIVDGASASDCITGSGDDTVICSCAETSPAVYSWTAIAGTDSVQTLTNKTLNSPTNDIHADTIHEQLRNETGSTINRGDAVNISVYSVGEEIALVSLADADSGTTMPSVALVEDSSIVNNATGDFIEQGTLSDFDTSAWTTGDDLYVSGVGTTGNTLTNVKPTGAALIQKVAIVLRSHATLGVVEVFGAGRANDLPNIADLNQWIGNGSGVPTATALPVGGTDGCSAAGDKPIWTASTRTWGCGTDAVGGVGGSDTELLFNNSSSEDGIASFTYVVGTDLLTFAPSVDAASGTEVAFSLIPTFNKVAGDAVAQLINVTDTLTAGTADYQIMSVGGTEEFVFEVNQGTATPSPVTFSTGDFGGGTVFSIQGSSTTLNFDSRTSTGAGLRHGDNTALLGSTVPSATIPGFKFHNDPDTGVGHAGGDVFTAIAGAATALNCYEGQLGSAAGDVVCEKFDLVTPPTSNPAANDLYDWVNTGQMFTRNNAGVDREITQLGQTIEGSEIAVETIDGENMNANYAGAHLSETAGSPDTIGAEPSLTTRVVTIPILDPIAATHDDRLAFICSGDAGCTITRVWCSTDVGTVNLNFEERTEAAPNSAGVDMLSAALVCNSTTQTSCAAGCDVNTIQNQPVDQYDPIRLMIDSVATAPNEVNIHVEYTVTD